jgi:ATP-dependent Clp protease ATP-binding subunit ClpC
MMLSSYTWLTAGAIAFLICLSDAFLTPGIHRPALNSITKQSVTSHAVIRHSKYVASTKLQMSTSASAMDRLPDSCIEAMSWSQSACRAIGVSTLENEMLIVGMIRSAGEDLDARKIFTDNGIFPDAAQQAAESLLIMKGLGKRGGGIIGDAPLPFSDGVKKTLDNAMSIAERMGGTRDVIVQPGHVLLALLDYDDRYNVATEDVAKCEGLAVLKKTVEDFGNFDGTKFCRILSAFMKNKAEEAAANGSTTVINEKQVVFAGNQRASSTPTLDKVGSDLTEMAREGRLDAVYGREKEIRMCLRTLGRRRKSNPCLIGEPGVGKTAIAEGLAQCLAGGYFVFDNKNDDEKWGIRNPFANKEDDKSVAGLSLEEINKLPPLPPCPRALQGFRVISLDMASLIAGMKYRGDFEERVQKLIQEASTSPTILFIDELHTLIGTGAGGGDGGMNAANLMKPALARGEIRGMSTQFRWLVCSHAHAITNALFCISLSHPVIGATTISEYRQYIERDGALERRFQPILVNEPTVDEAIDILNAVVPRYEDFHGVRYTPFALDSAARLAERYINDRSLPDKAIDVLDEAGSLVKLEDDGEEDDLPEDFFVVTEDIVAQVVSEITQIPVGKLDRDEKAKLMRLEADIAKRVKGQDVAVNSVSRAIRRARSGLRDQSKPVATFLFCGPTG